MTCIPEMPALKMKSKSSTDCVRGHNLHACHKLIKASKCLHSQVKTSQQTAALDNSVQNLPDACSNIEVPCQHVEITEVDVCPDILSGTSSKLLKLPSSAIDPLSSVTMGSPSVICSTNLETIFSPNFEHDESHFKMINHDDSVRNEQAELPHLVADDSDDGSCSSSDFQAYHELDFYIPDNVAVSLSPFDRDMGFIDIENTISRDFESMNHDMIIDMTDRYMIPPYLEKPVDSSNICNEDSFDGAMMNSDDVCLYLSIHQMKSDQETEISGFLDDLEEIEYIDQQLVFRNLPVLSEAVSSVCPILSQKETQKRKLVTLVLDLDETLVHSTLEHCNDADFTFTVFFNMKHHTVYVRRRPYLQMFLEKVAQMFEVIIFTASQSIYAEQLLDELDPDRNLITQRIYREACIFSEGSYTKDLTVLGVDLAKVAIVDNSPQVFRLQVNNGIPIESWFDDPSDHALISLLPFLETLVDADDVRPIIAGRFGNDCLVSH